jgi:hypothetical protein
MWRAGLEQTLRAEAEHPMLLSHVAKYRSLMPLALIGQVIDAVDAGTRGPVGRAATVLVNENYLGLSGCPRLPTSRLPRAW